MQAKKGVGSGRVLHKVEPSINSRPFGVNRLSDLGDCTLKVRQEEGERRSTTTHLKKTWIKRRKTAKETFVH